MTKPARCWDWTTMNSYLKKSQLNPLKDEGVTKLSGSLKTPLVVRSQCGRLDYLSPLGVLMVIQQSIECLKTTPSTTPAKPKRKPETVYKQTGLTPVTDLRTRTPGGVAGALGVARFQAQPTSESNYESRSRGLTMHQFQDYQETQREGITGLPKVKKTGLYRLNSRRNT